jgi:probable F420-dependent oxidoreductase
MKVGVTFPQTEIGTDPGAIRDYAQAAEEMGYEYLLAYDHVLGADPSKHTLTGPYTHETMFHEPFVLFGYLAALTTRVDLVTGVIILPQRQTALVAKQTAEIDILSGGRLILGVGLGWNQVEYEALGEDFRTRGRRVEEQVDLLRALWADELVTFEGRFDTVNDAGIHPRPGREIPIWMGGITNPVLQRIGRMADGWLALDRYPREPERTLEDLTDRLGRIHAAARDAGRDPSSIAVASGLGVMRKSVDEQVAEAIGRREFGATHMHVDTMNAGFKNPDEHIAAVRAFIEAYRSAT